MTEYFIPGTLPKTTCNEVRLQAPVQTQTTKPEEQDQSETQQNTNSNNGDASNPNDVRPPTL